MLTLKESILRSNSANLNWLSQKYNEFKLCTVYRDAIEYTDTSNINEYYLNQFFYVNKVIKHKGLYIKNALIDEEVLNSRYYCPINLKFAQALSNILYNCSFDKDDIQKKLKGLIKPHVTIDLDYIEHSSGNPHKVSYYRFYKTGEDYLQFAFAAQ